MNKELFVGSPFLLTATPELGASWAGRPDLRSKVERMIRPIVARPDSTLDLIWANFGGGKSHVLYYISHVIQRQLPNSIVAFVEVPEQTKNFLELYRRIVPKLPWSRIAKLVSSDSSLPATSQLRKVARVIEHGNDHEKALAFEWLFAGSVNLRDLKSFVGVQSRIESDVSASDLLSELLGILSRQNVKFVLLFDEFQRIGALSEKQRWAVLSNLRSLFTQNPTDFSVFLAAATRLEKTAVELLPPELRTLMGPRPIVSLPEMDAAEAMLFVEGRFSNFRPVGYNSDPLLPFNEEILREVIRFLTEEAAVKLIPRMLLQALSVIYDEYFFSGEMVDASGTRALLKALSWQET